MRPRASEYRSRAALIGAALVLLGTTLACAGSAPAAQMSGEASAPAEAPAPGDPTDPTGPVHPLARRQATAQAQQAPALAQARAAAEATVAAREAAILAAQEQAKAEAVGLLGQAVSARLGGQPEQALRLARQALERWPEYAEARSFLSEVAPEATAQAHQVRAQATAQARATATAYAQATAQARRAPRTPAGAPGGGTTPRPTPAPVAGDVIAAALGVIGGVDNATIRELSVTLVQNGVVITFGRLPSRVTGVWQPRQRTITVAEQYRGSSAEGIAGVLVHEATHVYDTYRGRDAGTVADCYDLEGRAFANQARFWELLYGRHGKRDATDPLEQQMNTILYVVNEKPLTFAVELLALYANECGP